MFGLFKKTIDETPPSCGLVGLPMFWKQASPDDVKTAFNGEFDLMCIGEGGKHPIYFAAKWASREAFRTLIGLYRDHAHYYYVSDDWQTDALYGACSTGNSGTIEQLLYMGANPVGLAFRDCVKSGNLEAVKLMLDAGADPSGHHSVGPDTTAKMIPKFMDATLYSAISNSYNEIALELIKRGADLNPVKTALDNNKPPRPLSTEQAAMLKYSKENGVTPLEAAWLTNLKVMRALVKAGADVQYNDNKALYVTVRCGSAKHIEFLLESGAKMWKNKNRDSLKDLIKFRGLKREPILGVDGSDMLSDLPDTPKLPNNILVRLRAL